MPAPSTLPLLSTLRNELADLAYVLERRGRRDAADVTMAIRARLDELAGKVEKDEKPGRGNSAPFVVTTIGNRTTHV